MATTKPAAYKNYIDGTWVASESGNTYEISNPASKSTIVGEFQTSGEKDALRAVAAAQKALPGWSDTPAPVRAGVLFRAIEIMRQRGDDIARTITIEEGKPLADAQGEIKRAMNIMEYAAGEGRRMFGYTTPVRAAKHCRLHRAASLGCGSHYHSLELPHRHSSVENCSSADLREHPGLQASLGNSIKRRQAGGGI